MPVLNIIGNYNYYLYHIASVYALTAQDTLENYRGDNPDADLQSLVRDEQTVQSKISRNSGRHRYLHELRSWETKSIQDRLCVICQSPFEVGALTKCGHLFCIIRLDSIAGAGNFCFSWICFDPDNRNIVPRLARSRHHKSICNCRQCSTRPSTAN